MAGGHQTRDAKAAPNVFASELAALYRGADPSQVSAQVFGADVEGVRWQYAMAYVLSHGELATGQLVLTPVRHHAPTDRLTLVVALEVLGRIRRKGARLVAQADPKNPKIGTALFLEDIARRLGVEKRAIQNRLRVFRQPVPHGGRGFEHKPLFKSREIMTKRGPRRTSQPRPTSPDAVVPKNGEFSYLEHEPATMLPPTVMRRLRLAWNELSDATPPAASKSPSSARPHACEPSAELGGPPRAGAPPPPEILGEEGRAAFIEHLRQMKPSWQK